jgi:L-2,4-diaminobutyrate decarboxylase
MKQHFNDYMGEFLTPSENNFADLLKKNDFLHAQIMQHQIEYVPRMPLHERFTYDKSDYSLPVKGRASSVVLSELATALQGSIRWNQPTTLVNITPNPLLDCVAASQMAALYNINSFWDYTSGRVTLLEKEVVNFLSSLAGWDLKKSDGLSVSGGKATLMYAIKCGLNTCDRKAVNEGLHGDYVVIAGKTSHYSIEDGCNYLGIGRQNVLRVDVDETGAMIPSAFETTLRSAITQGKKVAAIIALGGDTLEHTVDPVRRLRDIRDSLTREYELDYTPWLHLDSVNAWVVLAFRRYNFTINPLKIEANVLHKIQTLTSRLAAVSDADSFSADFHKTGLAPYASSFFVAKQGTHIHSINKDTPLTTKPVYQFGEAHTHHISFENSRSASGILCAWTSIQRLGVEGYQCYWAQLMTIGAYINEQITKILSHEIVVVNATALGHPNVIQFIPRGFPFTYDELLTNKEALAQYSDYCFAFYDYMAHRLLGRNQPYPLMGFVPSYKYEQTGIKRPAFLIYLNYPHIREEECNTLLQQIIALKHEFETQWQSTIHSKRFKRPEHLPK